MGDLVVTMPHALIAQTNCENKLSGQERGPEFNVCFFRRRTPAMVAPFSDAARDYVCQINTPKLVLTRHPRDHTVTETAARTRPWHQPGAHSQCLFSIGRLPGNSGDAFERGWVAGEAMTIADDRENIFAGMQQTKRFGTGRPKNCDPSAIRYVAAAKFASSLKRPHAAYFGSIFEARRYFLPRNALEAWLGMREVNVRAKAKRRREIVAMSACRICNAEQLFRDVVSCGRTTRPPH